MKEYMLLLATVFQYICTYGYKECPPLPGIGLRNGRFRRLEHDSVQLECNKDFVLHGPTSIRCVNGVWTPAFKAQCLLPENICSVPPEVKHASKIGDEREIGSVVFYICHDGYFMIGHKRLTCTATRHWDHDPPECIGQVTSLSEIASRLQNQLDLSHDTNTTVGDRMEGLILGPEVYKNGLELIFLVDRSSSVGSVDLERSNSFLKALLNTFGVDNSLKNSLTRLAVISFGDVAKVECSLDNEAIINVEEAMKQINSIKPAGGGTAMQPALSLVMEFELRDDTERAVFLLTDGEPNVGEPGIEPEEVADLLKQKGFQIFTVGIGKAISKERLAKIASEPTYNHVFFLNNFQDINTILDLVQNPPTTTTPAPPPSPKACGLSTIETDRNKPWLTAIFVHHSRVRGGLTFCSGVLVCSQWVLTNAACFRNETGSLKPYQIGLSVNADDLTAASHNAFAKEVFFSPKHQEMQPIFLRLALVKLDKEVPEEMARPVCLHRNKDWDEPLPQDPETQALLEGWGTRSWNSSLSSMTLSPSGTRQWSIRSWFHILEESLCTKAIRKEANVTEFLRKRLFCTGMPPADIPRKPSLPCTGSLGSSLVTSDTEGRHMLRGIQTTLHGCPEGPVIYLDTEYYVPWIDRVTDKCQQDHKN